MEVAPTVEENLIPPMKNLQKKTDLFQLQKVSRSFVLISLIKGGNVSVQLMFIQTLSSWLQTLLEMNESRRSKKKSPFETLRNEVLEFIDSLVK